MNTIICAISVYVLHEYLRNILFVFYVEFRVFLRYYDYTGKGDCNNSVSGKEIIVPLVYKEDVLTALKDHGYNTTKLRKE